MAAISVQNAVSPHLEESLHKFKFATSVSVSGWTLVCLSVERYYAICHPFRSRAWQTLAHSYRLIGIIWFLSLTLMLPIAVLSRLIPTNSGHRKCREMWPNEEVEKAYTLLLDALLLIIPLIVMVTTYSLVASTLWKTIHRPENQRSDSAKLKMKRTVEYGTHNLRRSNTEKALKKKKRIVKMLFAVVLEFFVCWTPLYVINTMSLFMPAAIYEKLGYRGISFLHLLAYTSSCCNPITYCFMNSSFRRGFLKLFGCTNEEKQVT